MSSISVLKDFARNKTMKIKLLIIVLSVFMPLAALSPSPSDYSVARKPGLARSEISEDLFKPRMQHSLPYDTALLE